MNTKTQFLLTTVVSIMSVDEIIERIEKEISDYKYAKISGGANPKNIATSCMLLLTKITAMDECGDDPLKLLDMLEKAEASRKIFETKPQ